MQMPSSFFSSIRHSNRGTVSLLTAVAILALPGAVSVILHPELLFVISFLLLMTTVPVTFCAAFETFVASCGPDDRAVTFSAAFTLSLFAASAAIWYAAVTAVSQAH